MRIFAVLDGFQLLHCVCF